MNMISQFSLEPLHLVDIGGTKRILKMLVERKASKIYLKPSSLALIDDLIGNLSPFIPSEFGQWKPKALKLYGTFKGKELKRFLKYDGLLTMWLVEEVLPQEHKGFFDCFLKYALGIRILSDPELCIPYADDANYLLEEFVKLSVKVFGPHFVVFNIHHLTHLADECKQHGPLENFDAYLYESYLGQLGKLMNAPGRPLPQIIARILEREKWGFTGSISTPKPELSSPYFVGPTNGLRGETHGEFHGDFTIRVSSPNDTCLLTKSREVVIVENILKDVDNNVIYFVGRSFVSKEPYFMSPIDSSVLDIFKVRSLGPMNHWSLSEIKKTCFLMPLDLNKNKLRERFEEGCLAVPFTHRFVKNAT